MTAQNASIMLFCIQCRHHAHMFTHAIMIDYLSSDRSVEIIREMAPSTWQVTRTRNPRFDPLECDNEVIWYESQYPDDWKLSLTISSFLITNHLRKLSQSVDARSKVFTIPFIQVVGKLVAITSFARISRATHESKSNKLVQ